MVHGRTTTVPDTAVIIPVMTAAKVPTATATTPQAPSILPTAPLSIRSEATVPPVAPISVPHRMKAILSVMAPGRSIPIPSTGVPRPVLTAATAPTNTQAILWLTVHGQTTLIRSTAEAQAVPAVTAVMSTQITPSPTGIGNRVPRLSIAEQ